MPVESQTSDYRSESYAVRGRTSREKLMKKIEVVSQFDYEIENRKSFIQSHSGVCINKLNEQKRSLGIVKVREVKECYFEERDNYTALVQEDLMGSAIDTKRNYAYRPKIKWRGENCDVKGIHDTQVLEWGAYEFMRKNKLMKKNSKLSLLNQLWSNYRLDRLNDFDFYFLIGNQKFQPTSFMIITVFYFPKEDQKKTTINNYKDI